MFIIYIVPGAEQVKTRIRFSSPPIRREDAGYEEPRRRPRLQQRHRDNGRGSSSREQCHSGGVQQVAGSSYQPRGCRSPGVSVDGEYEARQRFSSRSTEQEGAFRSTEQVWADSGGFRWWSLGGFRSWLYLNGVEDSAYLHDHIHDCGPHKLT